MSKTEYQPDYTHILQVLYNRRPGRLPVYEHHIDVPFISKVLGREITPGDNKPADLVGYEQLCIMLYSDPDLFTDIFTRIGDLYDTLWSEMIRRYKDLFVFFRMGDDLGFKSSTLLPPETIIEHILPQYKRVIGLFGGIDVDILCQNSYDDVFRWTDIWE